MDRRVNALIHDFHLSGFPLASGEIVDHGPAFLGTPMRRGGGN